MNTDDDKRWLYGKMRNAGVETGSYTEFTASLNDKADRDWYYQKSVELGLDVGDEEEFRQMMSSDVQTTPQDTTPAPQPTTPTKQTTTTTQPTTQPKPRMTVEQQSKERLLDMAEKKFGTRDENVLRQMAQQQFGTTDPKEIQSKAREQMAALKQGKPVARQTQDTTQNDTLTLEQAQQLSPEQPRGIAITHPELISQLANERPDEFAEWANQNPDKIKAIIDNYPEQLQGFINAHPDLARQFAQKHPDVLPKTEKQQAKDDLAAITTQVNQRFDELSEIVADENREVDKQKGFWQRVAEGLRNAEDPSHTGGVADRVRADYERHPELREITAAKRALERANNIVNEASRKGNTTFAGGAARGFAHTVTDISTWDFGMTDMLDGKALMDALDAADEGKPLTADQQALLDAKAVEMAVEMYYSQDLGKGYNAGRVAGEALPFMVEMAMNPAARMGSAAGNKMARYITERFAKKALKKAVKKTVQKLATKAAKAAVRTVGDVVGAGLMTVSTGSMQTAADAFDRYNSAKMQGKDITLSEAFGKAFVGQTIERHSEMLGEYFAPLLRLGGKGFNFIGNSKFGKALRIDKVQGFINDVSGTQIAKITDDFLKQTKWDGSLAQWSEEVVGGVENALLVGDQTLDTNADTGVFNLDNNIDTFISVALMGGLFSGTKTAGYRTPKHKARKQMEQASDEALSAFGDNADLWNGYRNTLSFGSVEEVKDVLREVMSNPDYTQEQRKAVLDYAKSATRYKGILAGGQKRRESGIDPQQMVNEEKSFEAGYDADEQTISDIAMEYANPDLGNKTEGERQAAWDGVQQQIEDSADRVAETMRRDFANKQHKTDGMVKEVKVLDDEGNEKVVYLVDGNVTMLQGGEQVDTEQSDQQVYIYDPQTDETKPIAATDIKGFVMAISHDDLEEQIQQARDLYVQQQTDAAQGKISINIGDEIPLSNGIMGKVLAISEDGEEITVGGIDENGNPQQEVMQRSDLQAVADATAIESYYQRHPNIARAEESETAEQQPVSEEQQTADEEQTPGSEETEQQTTEETPQTNTVPQGYVEGVPDDYTNGMEVTFNEDDDGDNFTDRDRAIARDEYERMVATGGYQFQEAMQDSMLGLRKAMQAILGAGKDFRIEEVPGNENAYLAENRMSSTNKAEQHYYYVLYMKPLLKAIHLIAGNSEAKRQELADYMMAKHGLERNQKFAERDFAEYQKEYPATNKTLDDFRDRDYAGLTALTGESDVRTAEAMAQMMVDEYEATHDVTLLWEATKRATGVTLAKIYRSGLLSKESYEQIRDQFDYYIPLQGFDETTSDEVYGYLTSRKGPFGSPIKHAEGRTSKADDPIATIALMADKAIQQANRNEMKKLFLNFVENHPSDLVSVSKLWLHKDAATGDWVPVFPDIEADDTPAEVERKVEEFETKMQQLAEQHPKEYKSGMDAKNFPYRVLPENRNEHQVLVKRNGETFVLTINGNPRAAQALNGLTNPDVKTGGFIGGAMKTAQFVNHQLSAFYTTRDPNFVVSNFFRDMLYSNCMTWVKEGGNYALNFHKNFGKFNPATMRWLFGKWDKGTLDDSKPIEYMFKQFMLNGGETGYTNIRDIEAHKREIARELKRQSSTTRQVWSLLGKQLDLLNESVENCARFAAFITSMEMGRSLERSIYDAKEVSVNFNKKGSGDKMVGATGQTKAGKLGSYLSGAGRLLYVFWNAGLQGMTNFGRAAKRHPAKFTAGAAAMFTLGAVIPLIAKALWGGDDDDENAYYNLPEYVRRSNICIGAGDQWITIPLPIEFRAIYGMGELATGVITGEEHYSKGETARQIISQGSQILPLDFMEGGGGWHAFIPSQVKPIVEASSNKSWVGLPIYKNTPYNQKKPEFTKVYKNADKNIVGASRWLNELTGGDDFKKGWADKVNPAQVEYVLNGYFGGYFKVPNQLVKMAETAFGDREFEWKNMIMANRLVKSGDERTANRKLQNEFFNLKAEYEETKRLLKEYENAANEGVLKYAEKLDYLENSKEYGRYLIFDEYKKDIDGAYKAMEEAEDEEIYKASENEYYEYLRELVDAIHRYEKGEDVNSILNYQSN